MTPARVTTPTLAQVLAAGDDGAGGNLLGIGSVAANSATLDSGGLSVNGAGPVEVAGGDVNVRGGGRVRVNIISPETGSLVTVDDGLVVEGSIVRMTSLPTSDPAVSGALWNDGGTLRISA